MNLKRAATALFLALAGLPAWASYTIHGTGGASVEYVSGGANIADGSGLRFEGRTFADPSPTRGVRIAETYRLPLGGNSLPVTVARTASALEVANAIALAGAAGYAGLQVGGIISHAIGNDTVTIGATRCTASYTGWKCDDGEPPPVMSACYPMYESNSWNNSTLYGCTPAEAADKYIKNVVDTPTRRASCSGTTHYQDPVLVSPAPAYPGGFHYTGGGCVTNGYTSTSVTDKGIGQSGTLWTPPSMCPPYIDGLNPAWSRNSPFSPDADGKCATGRYGAKSPPEVAPRIRDWVPNPGLRDGAQDWMDHGGDITTDDGMHPSGPGSMTQPDTTTTTQNPDGSTTTTTQHTTTNYQYGGPDAQGRANITYNTTVVTTSTNNVTNQTTTTTTTTGSGQPGQQPQDDPCTSNPGRAGCSDLGTPPTDAVSWSNKTITYAVEDLGFAGSCPPNHTFSLRGWSLVLNYQPVCDVAPTISTGLQALAAFSAIAMIVLTVSKT